MAVDGNPQIYYEDLFDNRDPVVRDHQDPVAQPLRGYLSNLICCHQKLNFKDAAYRVDFQGSQDLLILERTGKAIIALNDNGSASQGPQAVVTAFSAGTVLHDYGISVAQEVTVGAGGEVAVTAVPPMHYCVWGPAGIGGGFVGTRVRRTTQVFRMDDDLGDSNPASLGDGGRLVPSNYRTAGAIWAAAGTTVRITATPNDARTIQVRALPPDPTTGQKFPSAIGALTQSAAGSPSQPTVMEFIAVAEGYDTVQAKLAETDDSAAAASISVNYDAPASSALIK